MKTISLTYNKNNDTIFSIIHNQHNNTDNPALFFIEFNKKTNTSKSIILHTTVNNNLKKASVLYSFIASVIVKLDLHYGIQLTDDQKNAIIPKWIDIGNLMSNVINYSKESNITLNYKDFQTQLFELNININGRNLCFFNQFKLTDVGSITQIKTVLSKTLTPLATLYHNIIKNRNKLNNLCLSFPKDINYYIKPYYFNAFIKVLSSGIGIAEINNIIESKINNCLNIINSLKKAHAKRPFVFRKNGFQLNVDVYSIKFSLFGNRINNDHYSQTNSDKSKSKYLIAYAIANGLEDELEVKTHMQIIKNKCQWQYCADKINRN